VAACSVIIIILFVTSLIPQWENTLALLPPQSAAATTTTTFSFQLHPLSHKNSPLILALDSAFPPLIMLALLLQGLCYATTYVSSNHVEDQSYHVC